MHADLNQVLFSEEQIARRVQEIGAQISRDYAGKPLVLVGILKGAVIFCSDLARAVSIPLSFDFMAISSYGAATRSQGVVRFIKDLDRDIVGKDVIIVEDIVDSGLTLSFLMDNLMQRGAASLATCVLLDKPDRRTTDVKPTYVGFVIPDAFVVGYGLDYAEMYRNLPYIGVLRPEIYTK